MLGVISSERMSRKVPSTYRKIAAIFLVFGCLSCGGSSEPGEDEQDNVERPEGWQDATHSKSADPNYDLLFDDENIEDMKVHRIDLVISDAVYQETMADLESIFGSACGSGGGGPGGGGGTGEDPTWVPIKVEHNGTVWNHVGMRYKGNSSLSGAWRSCIKKFAFRLDFDQFEEEYPTIKDQRFHGFKKMTFSNAYKDDSLIRDKLGADIFRRAGIPTARGAFTQVYATIGTAPPVYLGLYTMIEDPSNKMLDTQFEDDSGNLYKPEAQWSNDTSANTLAAEFEKKTNEEEGDWSDIVGAINALHSSSRVSAPASWRSELEQYFDVSGFIKWLALNQAMVNWDTYGCIAHNYYVYADPTDATASAPNGRLTWFPWDLNESMLEGGRCAQQAQRVFPSLGNEWPLVSYLLDDNVYLEQYKNELANVISTGNGFDAAWVKTRISGYHDLISEYVVGPTATESNGYSFLSSTGAFGSSVAELQSHLDERVVAVENALD